MKTLPSSFLSDFIAAFFDKSRDGSDSTDAPMSLEDLPSQNKKHRSRNAIYRRRKRTFRKKKPSENGVDDQIRLSKSLDDIDMVL